MFRVTTTRLLSTSVHKAPPVLAGDMGKVVPLFNGDILVPGSNLVKPVPLTKMVKPFPVLNLAELIPIPDMAKPVPIPKLVKPVPVSDIIEPIPVSDVAKQFPISNMVDVISEPLSFFHAITRGVPDPDDFSYRAALLISMTPTPGSLMHNILYGVEDPKTVELGRFIPAWMKFKTSVTVKKVTIKEEGGKTTVTVEAKKVVTEVESNAAVLGEARKKVQEKGARTVEAVEEMLVEKTKVVREGVIGRVFGK